MIRGCRVSFPVHGGSKYISTKELPIVLAVMRWGQYGLINVSCFFFKQNAVVAVINKQTSRDPQLMYLLRQLIIACLSYNIYFRAKHILCKINVVAYLISRLQIARARTVQHSLDDKTTPGIHCLHWHARTVQHSLDDKTTPGIHCLHWHATP